MTLTLAAALRCLHPGGHPLPAAARRRPGRPWWRGHDVRTIRSATAFAFGVPGRGRYEQTYDCGTQIELDTVIP